MAVPSKYQFSTCARAFLFDFSSMQQQRALYSQPFILVGINHASFGEYLYISETSEIIRFQRFLKTIK